jgi:hypothetical protein
MFNLLVPWLLFGTVAVVAGAGGGPLMTPAQIAAQMEKEGENTDFRSVTTLARRGELTRADIEFHSNWMMVSLAAFAALPLVYRFCSVVYSRVRLVVSLGVENQRYFSLPTNEWVSFFKKHILYSPLFRVRHNREFQLSTAVNVGTLPTRFQTFFLLGYLVGNVVFCTFMIDWKADTGSMLGQVRNRTGVLSTVNMVPLVLLAGRNNPLIQLLGISFDTYNLIHRWLGRTVVLEAVAHSFCYMVAKAMKGVFFFEIIYLLFLTVWCEIC